MLHNEKGYLIDRRRFKAAYGIQYKLEVHTYTNRNNKNKEIITLGNLLKDCYELPTFEDVKNSNRNYTSRIKKPLVDNIHALRECGILSEYYFCDAKGNRFSTEELLQLEYKDFIKCRLHYTLELNNYTN